MRQLMLVTAVLLASQTAYTQESKPTTAEVLRSVTQAPLNAKAEELTLVTRSRNLEELGYELTGIYVALYNAPESRLSVQRVSDRTGKFIGKTIEEILRLEGLFYGKTFPQQLDNLTCDLNSHVCNRIRAKLTDEELRSTSTLHVRGLHLSESEWLTGPATLLFPHVEITTDSEWYPIEKPRERSLRQFVVEDLGGCEEFDDECRDLITFYNRTLGEKIFDENYLGTRSLPVLTLTIKANVATATETLISADPDLPNKDEEFSARAGNVTQASS